jgi:hypothetical protein
MERMSCVVSASEVVARARAQVRVVAVNMHTLYPAFAFYPHNYFFCSLPTYANTNIKMVWPYDVS